MMNVYQFENKHEQSVVQERKKGEYINRFEKLHTDQLKSRALGYRARVEKFIMKMLDKPVNVDGFHELKEKFRNEDKSKFLGGGMMRMGTELPTKALYLNNKAPQKNTNIIDHSRATSLPNYS